MLCLAGRNAAFAEIMVRHREPIFRLVHASIGDADEALDLVQETFISSIPGFKAFRSRTIHARLALDDSY